MFPQSVKLQPDIKTVSVMGYTPSKYIPDICESEETPELLAAYFAKKKGEGKQENFEDQSENLNIGLINYKSDSESFIPNMDSFTWTEILECIILGICS